MKFFESLSFFFSNGIMNLSFWLEGLFPSLVFDGFWLKFILKCMKCWYFLKRLFWAFGFFRSRLMYAVKLWVIELRLLYIFSIVFLLVVLYLPPMEDIDILWWLCNNLFELFLFVYSLVSFLYYFMVGMIYFFVGFVTSSFFFYSWFIDLWNFFATYWIVRFFNFEFFYYELLKKKFIYLWYHLYYSLRHLHKLQISILEGWRRRRFAKAIVLTKKFKLWRKFIRDSIISTSKMQILRVSKGRSIFSIKSRVSKNKAELIQARSQRSRKLYRYAQSFLTRFYGVCFKFWFSQIDLHYYLLVVSLWFVLFVFNIYAFLLMLFKLLYFWCFIPCFYYVYMGLNFVFCKVMWILSVYIWPFILYLVVLVCSLFVSIFSDCFMDVYNNLLGLFFLLVEWFKFFNMSLEEYIDILFTFCFSSNYFTFFWQGFVYFLEYLFEKFWFLLKFLGWLFKLLDSLLLNISIYVSLQVFLLKCYVYVVDIIVVMGTEMVYVGLVIYHVMMFTVIHCLDYVDFSASHVGVGIWWDLYFLMVASWMLDFEYRWYSRAMVKPTPLVYEDIVKKSVFLPKLLQHGPMKTQYYIQQYLKNAYENPEKYMYYKPSKYFRWYFDDSETLLDMGWIYAQGQLYSLMVDSRDLNSMSFVDWYDFGSLERVQDFEYFYEPFKRATAWYSYGFKEFEDIDLNYDIEDLMDWYMEWHAYELGVYSDAEMFKYVENYSPVVPTVEILAVGFQAPSMLKGEFEDLDYYYDAYFYPHYPMTVFMDDEDVNYICTNEHGDNIDCAITYRNVVSYVWMVPFIWCMMFWLGWGSSTYWMDALFEEGVIEFQLTNMITFALSTAWFDWMLNWHFLDFFPFFKVLLDDVRVYGRNLRMRVWGISKIWGRSYNSANQARQLFALSLEHPWLASFKPKNPSYRWMKYWILPHNTGVMSILHKKHYSSKSSKMSRFYNWSELAELDFFLHFFSVPHERSTVYKIEHNLESCVSFTFQFVRNSYKKLCRYSSEDFSWLSAWKSFYKATGLSSEDLYFPYEFFKYEGVQNRVFSKKVRKLSNVRDVFSYAVYNQIGTMGHSFILDDKLYNWWCNFYFFLGLFDKTTDEGSFLPRINDSRFYSFGYNSLFNSWRYLYSVTFRNNLGWLNYPEMWRFYGDMYRTWRSVFEYDMGEWASYPVYFWYTDSWLNSSTTHYSGIFSNVRSNPWEAVDYWKEYGDSSFSFISAFNFEQMPFARLYPLYLPRFFLRTGNYLFYKYYRKELSYKYGYEVYVSRGVAHYRKLDPYGLSFFRNLEFRLIDTLYRTVLNKYNFMEYKYLKSKRKYRGLQWYVIGWPMQSYDEINLRHIKHWSGLPYKQAYWGFMGRFPFYRYESLGYSHYNFMGLSGQRRRWMTRYVVPYFLD